MANLKTEHGHCVGYKSSPTYGSWIAMFNRCYNPKNPSYKYYGGRGIRVCEESWSEFTAFLSDMGEKPQGCSLDRIDNSLGYSKANCRWATAKTQARNRAVTKLIEANGESMTIKEWADRLGIKVHTLRYRLYYGWSIDRALSEPLHHTR